MSGDGHRLIVVITCAPGDEGAQYTLTFPDGQQALIGDAQDAYHELAGIIDDAIDDAAEGMTVPGLTREQQDRYNALVDHVGHDKALKDAREW